jgi:hypothetical protein
MPGFFPGRPGGEHDEPLLDMILERRPIPPGAPPEIHDLAHMLAAVAGPAEPGELTGAVATLAAFTRLGSPAGISPAAPRSARRSMPEWRARGRLPLAAAVTAVAAGLGGTAAAYAGVLPDPIQHVAYEIIGAPSPHHEFSGHVSALASSPTHAPRRPATFAAPESQEAVSSVPGHGHSSPRDRQHGSPGDLLGNARAGCRPTAAGTQNQSQNQNQNQSKPSPTPASVTPSPGQSQTQGQGQGQGKSQGQNQAQGQGQSTASPGLKLTPQASMTIPVPAWLTTTACPTAGLPISRPGR